MHGSRPFYMSQSDAAKYYRECEELLKKCDVNYINLRFSGLGSAIEVTDDYIKRLVTLLATNPYVESIDLSYNTITCDGAKILANFILQSKTIKYVDLSHNHIGSIGIECLRIVASARSSCRIIYEPQKTIFAELFDNLGLSSMYSDEERAEAAKVTLEEEQENHGSYKLIFG